MHQNPGSAISFRMTTHGNLENWQLAPDVRTQCPLKLVEARYMAYRVYHIPCTV